MLSLSENDQGLILSILHLYTFKYSYRCVVILQEVFTGFFLFLLDPQ